MESQGMPVIVCGRREEIGRVVADHLQPDYEGELSVLLPNETQQDACKLTKQPLASSRSLCHDARSRRR